MHVVITGASSGIGAALARALAEDGHSLFVCARRRERLANLFGPGSGVAWRRCDVSQERQVVAFATWLKGQAPHIDALINCAGSVGAIGPTIHTDSREWRGAIETNLFGTYFMTKHVAPMMAGSPSPRIINFSGGGAFNPFPNYSAYGVSKAAVIRLTESLAVEMAPLGIAVNALAPGSVATEIHRTMAAAGPDKAGAENYRHALRMMSGEEPGVPMATPVACVRFLLSQEARGLTGKTISASFDPWRSPAFSRLIPELNRADLYALRRINLVNLPEGPLRNDLTAASAGAGG